jgi:hypothetical protein
VGKIILVLLMISAVIFGANCHKAGPNVVPVGVGAGDDQTETKCEQYEFGAEGYRKAAEVAEYFSENWEERPNYDDEEEREFETRLTEYRREVRKLVEDRRRDGRATELPPELRGTAPQ